MDVKAIVELVKQTPQVQQAVDLIEQQLNSMPIMPEDLDDIIGMLEAVVEDPSRYPAVIKAAVQDGVISPEDAPPEYDPTFVLAVLVALYEYRNRLTTQGYARGGLKVASRQLAAAGRGGDTMLAHINPREAEMLRRMGGAGTINPNTGLREYKGGVGKILSIAAPIALDFIAPGLGMAIGTTLGASGVAAGMLGSAVIGGVSSGLTGGDPLKGALLGGLGGGLGGSIGSTLAPGLGELGQNMLGNALVGGVAGAVTGRGFGRGALMGAAGAGLGAATQGLADGALGAGIGSAGRFAGNMLTAGFKPKEALIGGALSGLATGMSYKPSQAVVGEMRETPGGVSKLNTEFASGEQAINPETGEIYYPTGKAEPVTTAQTPTAGVKAPAGSNPLSLGNIGTLAVLSSLSGGRPPEVDKAMTSLSTQQQEYFNRPNVRWDWNKMQSDANMRNMSLSEYMASYWPQITSGAYNSTKNMAVGGMYAAGGGALGAVARLVRGGGSGRDDTVNARLSDGEYVMDAETVAMLGDGSTDAGARRLDMMREQLRKHKGKTLAKGKFSPNAKSPLAYLKGAA